MKEPVSTIGLCGALGATAGLLAGVYEASLLSSIPRIPGLVSPDVGAVIWFLAPLIGLLTLGVLGLVVGAAMPIASHGGQTGRAALAAAGMGLAVTYVFSLRALLQVNLREQALKEYLPPVIECFLMAFVIAFLLLWLFRHRTSHFLASGRRAPVANVAKLNGILVVLLVLGIAICEMLNWGAGTPLAAEAPPSRGPNIVLITLDTTRADHFSSYGYSRATTPYLDHLAGDGVLFENAVSSTSWTLPSHASMLTGLLPHQHGVNVAVGFPPGVLTLGEILQAHGYETAGFNANYYYGLAGWGMGRGLETYVDGTTSLRHNLFASTTGRIAVQRAYENLVRYDMLTRHNAREINRRILEWFHHRSSRPFFLFVNYLDVHDPYHAPRPYQDRFGTVSDALLRKVSFGKAMQLQEPLNEEERASVTAGYDNCLAFTDEQVGLLLDAINPSSAGRNTIVIVTADHGEALGEHGTYGHGWNLYREAIHVPLIISGKGLPRGLRVSHPIRLHELFATVLDLALSEKSPLSRLSLRRFWTPGFVPAPFDAGAVSELSPIVPTPGAPGYTSLVTRDWHYIRDTLGHEELYRWGSDAQEIQNLTDAPEYEPVTSSLRNMLRDYLAGSLRPWRGPGYLNALDNPRSPFAHEALFSPAAGPSGLAPGIRFGASQAFFARRQVVPSAQPTPIDQDLLHTMPYQ
jgi:arylsulfatase A-like enzyme